MGLISKILKKNTPAKEDIAEVKSDEKSAVLETKADKTDKVKVASKKDTSKSAVSTKTSKVKKLDATNQAHDILLFPLVTEKAAVSESINKYLFIVAKWSNKIQIKKAIQDIYGILPETVRTINYEGKSKKFRRLKGKRKDYKKAIVTMPKGKTIDIHKGV